jgi:hypothetical protein
MMAQLTKLRQNMLTYEDPALKMKALRCIPVPTLRQRADGREDVTTK